MEQSDDIDKLWWAAIAKRISHRQPWSTESKALDKSKKVMKRGFCCSMHFTCSCLAEKIMSIVPLDGLKPHWDSGRICSATGDSRFCSSLAKKVRQTDWQTDKHTDTQRDRETVLTTKSTPPLFMMARFYPIFWSKTTIQWHELKSLPQIVITGCLYAQINELYCIA